MNLLDELQDEAADQENRTLGDGSFTADLLRRTIVEIGRLQNEAVKVEGLRDLLFRLLAKLPHETRDLTAGWCAGCGVVRWCGDGEPADPCKLDCVLREAIKAAKAAGENDVQQSKQ